MIVVTGASGGLGSVVARRLYDRGETVVGISRSEYDAPYETFRADVSDHSSLKSVAREIRKRSDELTGLVNAAGIASMNLALTTPAEVVHRIVNTNLVGTIFSCQAFAPLMIRAKRGSIVNFSTIAVALGLEGESVYVASKAGVEGFTKSFAREVSAAGIAVNCVAPGPIDTNLIAKVPSELITRLSERQVVRRKFSPEEVADVVCLLLDMEGMTLSGQTLNVGGV